MKNIYLIILTFFTTLSLFGQTEPRDEFRTSTGILQSVTGTNFKKDTVIIGGKKVIRYRQPNTDTYNTFSIVNDSVRIQKWKLDTATNVFVTSNLNDVYLDNLVNKPSVDSRVVLDMVNDSLKVEVWDIINNTLLSTYYVDNVGNHPETVTTITDTLVGAHLIANYTNEANTIRGIYESVIKVDSITNGYVITKEDGTKDTIKINSTGFYTLTDISDTLALSAVAASKCPALTIAKLDSCNIAYLYMYNCNTGAWENFKTPNIKTATRTLYVDRSLGNNTKAKEECPTCQFEYPEDALSYAVSKGIENPSIQISADTFTWGLGGRVTYPTITGLLDKHGGSVHFTQDKAGVLRINKNTGSPFSLLYRTGNNFKTDYYFDLGTLISDGQSSGKHFILLSTNTTGSNDELSSVYFKAKNIIFKHTDIPVPNYGFMGNILQCKSKNLIVDVDNIETDVAGFIIDGGVNQNVSINVNNYIQTNARAGNSNFLYIRGGRLNSNVSFTCRNYQNKINYGYGVLLDLNVSPAIAESQTTGLNYKVKGYIDNYVRTDTTFFYPRKGTGTFDGFGSAAFITIWNRLSIPSTTTNVDYFIEANNVEEIYPIINNEFIGQTIINSKIHLKVNNAKSKSSCISLSGWTLVNSQILIEGDFTSDSTKCVSIHDNIIDATSSITLKGKFKTTSPTLEAMEIGNNSGVGVNNIIINGQIITGGGFSIDNPSGTQISVKVMPGCSSNVTTSANVTQLGTGIYVDPNFNN